MTDPASVDGLNAARRAAARRLHPDLGGDADEFARVMAAFDRRRGDSGGNTTPGAPVLVRSRLRRTRHAVAATGRGLLGRVRTRLPTSWPGARRYGRL